MKKSLKTLVVSLLSSNFIVGSMATIVTAEEGGTDVITNSDIPTDGGETGVDTGTDTGETGDNQEPGDSDDSGETGNPGDDEGEPGESDESNESEESESSEEPESEESTEDTPTPTVPTYPVTPPGSTEPSRTTPRTPVTTSEDETTSTVVEEYNANKNLDNLKSLLSNSLEDPNFQLAWEDYQAIVTDYSLNDVSSGEMAGSSIHDIVANFVGNAVPIRTENAEGQVIAILSYVDSTSEEGATPAHIILVGDAEGNLIGSGLFQASNNIERTTSISSSMFDEYIGKRTNELFAQDFKVSGLYQALHNGVIYTSFATPSEVEGSIEFVTMDSHTILDHLTIEYSEEILLTQLQLEISTLVENLDEVKEVEENTADESVSSEDNEEDVEDEVELSAFATVYAPESFDSSKLSNYEELSSGYQELLTKVNEGKLIVSEEELTSMLGEPNSRLEAGTFVFYNYYSIEDERVSLLEIQSNSEDDSLSSVLYEVRTPSIENPFGITIDDLFNIASEELSISNLVNHLGEANLTEHLFTTNYQTRYVWTSFEDPEMRSIEAFEDNATGDVELFYYDQN